MRVLRASFNERNGTVVSYVNIIIMIYAVIGIYARVGRGPLIQPAIKRNKYYRIYNNLNVLIQNGCYVRLGASIHFIAPL